MIPADLPTGVVLTNAYVQKLPDSLFNLGATEVAVLRLDKLDPDISGNKWFKLACYHEKLTQKGKIGMVSFGGPYSNHLIALAKHCKNNGLKSAAFIRGNYFPKLSTTLQQLQDWGMDLLFTSLNDYANPNLLKDRFSTQFQDYVWIPEGGAGVTGIKGAGLISQLYPLSNYTHIGCAVGTGTTMAGLLKEATAQQTIIGVSALKMKDEQSEIKAMLEGIATDAKFELFTAFHEGGYGKTTPALLNFMNRFYEETQIPTDIVYTGKLFKGIFELIANAYFPPKSKLLLIHSGGLQGNRSLPSGSLNF